MRRTALILLIINIVGFTILYLASPLYFTRTIKVIKKSFLNINIREVSIYLSILFSCFFIEALVMGWKRSSLYRLIRPSATARSDLAVAGITVLEFSGIIAIFSTFGMSYVFPAWFKGNYRSEYLQIFDSIFLQFFVWLFVYDFLDYWYHRIMHNVGFLWEMHKFHHAATEFNIITGKRVHILEHVFRSYFHAIPLALLGSPIEMFLSVMLVRKVVDIFQHSMINWSYGWVGRWLVVSPITHRIHHSILPEHLDKNYGNILPIWDRIFGSWYEGDKLNDFVDAIDNPYNKNGVIHDYLLCFKLSGQRLVDSIKSNKWSLDELELGDPLPLRSNDSKL